MFNIGLALNLDACRDGTLGEKIKKDMAKASRKATQEFKEARQAPDFVQKLIAREVSLPMKEAQMTTMHDYVDKFRKAFDGVVIHRTIHSLDWTGKPISGLPPLHESVLALQPSEEEKKALMVMADEIVHDENATKGKYLNKADNVSFLFPFHVRSFLCAMEPDPVGSSHQPLKVRFLSRLRARRCFIAPVPRVCSENPLPELVGFGSALSCACAAGAL